MLVSEKDTAVYADSPERLRARVAELEARETSPLPAETARERQVVFVGVLPGSDKNVDLWTHCGMRSSKSGRGTLAWHVSRQISLVQLGAAENRAE